VIRPYLHDRLDHPTRPSTTSGPPGRTWISPGSDTRSLKRGRPIDEMRVEELANRVNISLRTGCFCIPGAGEAAHELGAEHMRKWFGRGEPMSYLELRDRIRIEHDRLPSAIRISVGVATNFADAYRFQCFLQGFADRSVAEIDQPAFAASPRHAG
jgi:molybdenum cofactor sulfurtransferase